MKTFVSALIIFALLCIFVFSASYGISQRLSELYELAVTLPASETEFNENEEKAVMQTKKLCSLWNESMALFPYVTGYNILERADEAAITLASCAESGQYNDFFSARLNFCDALLRLKTLYGISIRSLA